MSLQQLNSNQFEETIYDNCEPCLVIFSRKSCHICKEVLSVLEKLQSQYEGEFGFYFVDAEENNNLCQRFSLMGVPQIVFFNEGEYKGKLAGAVEAKEVKEKIAEVLGNR